MIKKVCLNFKWMMWTKWNIYFIILWLKIICKCIISLRNRQKCYFLSYVAVKNETLYVNTISKANFICVKWIKFMQMFVTSIKNMNTSIIVCNCYLHQQLLFYGIFQKVACLSVATVRFAVLYAVEYLSNSCNCW